MPGIQEEYRDNSDGYLANLLGHEGKGSILSLLKKKSWANGLGAGTHNNCTDFSTFHVSITVTDEAIVDNHVTDIVAIVFAYVRMITTAGPQAYFYEECATMGANEFRFANKSRPFSAVSNISSAMRCHRPEDSLSYAYKYSNYNPEGIMAMLKYLTPENVNIYVTHKQLHSMTEY